MPPEAFAAIERQLRDDLDGWIEENAQPFAPGASARTIARLAEMVQRCSRRAIVEYQRAVARGDFRAELAAIDVPLTIIQGDLDVSAPPALCGERVAALKPDAEYLAYPGAAHGPMVTHAALLADDIATRARWNAGSAASWHHRGTRTPRLPGRPHEASPETAWPRPPRNSSANR